MDVLKGPVEYVQVEAFAVLCEAAVSRGGELALGASVN